jgi:hypothetical protein
MIKAISRVDSGKLVSVYEKIEADIQWTEYGHKGRQTGLQYKLDDDPWTSAVGKHHTSELAYHHLNPLFKDTEFEEVIKKYRLLRTRLMWVYPFACYSMHQDEYPRIHIPLITNPACYFIINEGIKNQTIRHLPVDMVYWVDTRKTHTFMNCSEHKRLHLVGVVES